MPGRAIVLALGIKAVFLALAGNTAMWLAVFADMEASLRVVFNGLRLLRIQPPPDVHSRTGSGP